MVWRTVKINQSLKRFLFNCQRNLEILRSQLVFNVHLIFGKKKQMSNVAPEKSWFDKRQLSSSTYLWTLSKNIDNFQYSVLKHRLNSSCRQSDFQHLEQKNDIKNTNNIFEMYIIFFISLSKKSNNEAKLKIRGAFNWFPDFFVQAFKFVVDAWKYVVHSIGFQTFLYRYLNLSQTLENTWCIQLVSRLFLYRHSNLSLTLENSLYYC